MIKAEEFYPSPDKEATTLDNYVWPTDKKLLSSFSKEVPLFDLKEEEQLID